MVTDDMADDHDRVRALMRERETLVSLCRAWSSYFFATGDTPTGVTADQLAWEIEAAGLGDIRRSGGRLREIISNWLADAPAANGED